MGDCGVLTTLQHVSSGMLSACVCVCVYYLSAKTPAELQVCHKHGFPGSLSDQFMVQTKQRYLKRPPVCELLLAVWSGIQDESQSLSNYSRNSQRYCGTKWFCFSFLNEWSWIQTASLSQGKDEWPGFPPPPLLVSGTPLSLDPSMPGFYSPKDILITAGFTPRPYSSTSEPFLSPNVSLFLLPFFCLFLLWLWQICSVFNLHKYGACIHPNTSAGVSITFPVNNSHFLCLTPLNFHHIYLL